MSSRHANPETRFLLLLALLAASVCACQSNDAADEAASPSAVEQQGPSPVEQIDRFISYRKIDKSNPEWRLHVPRPPNLHFPRGRKLFWVLDTNTGVIKIELKPKHAPKHVATTIYLTRIGFYDDLIFHRIIPRFMAQGGDPLGDGTGGPGFTYSGEVPRRPQTHAKGSVSAANSGPHTDGSQFFILFDKADHLDGKHTIFGEVVEGWGTLRALELAGSASGKPTNRRWIRRATIFEE